MYSLSFSSTHRVVGSHGSDGVTSQSGDSKQLRRNFIYCLCGEQR